MSETIEVRTADTVYVARSCDGENFIVISDPDGTFRRWKLSDLLLLKIAKESTPIAIDLAIGARR